MRELVDKRLMLEDVKSWVAMDSYEQHLINNMSEWIENLPTVEVSDGDCISRRAALDAMKKITFPHWFECGEYLSEDTREIEIINSKKALEVIEALPSVHPEKEIAKRVLWTGWKGCRDTRYKCPNCKKPVKNDDIYCHRCGQKLMFPHISFTDYVPGEKQETIVRWDDE